MKLTLTAIFSFCWHPPVCRPDNRTPCSFPTTVSVPILMKTRPEGCVPLLTIAKAERQSACVQKRALRLLPEDAVRKEYFITNTSTEQECPSKVKTIGLFFEEMQGLTVEGNDATLMFHGKMTMIAFAHSKQMKLRNLHIDFER